MVLSTYNVHSFFICFAILCRSNEAEYREVMNIQGIRTTHYYAESKPCAITKVQDSSIIQAALHIETDICST